jgi:hypothetical protein
MANGQQITLQGAGFGRAGKPPKPEDNDIISRYSLPPDQDRQEPETGNHHSGIGLELSLVFCAGDEIFCERFHPSQGKL